MRHLITWVLVACAHAPSAPPSREAADHLGRGIQALRVGDLDRAGAELELALEYEPRQPEALCGLGLVAMKRGDTARARGWLGAALAVNPELAEAHNNLGALDVEAGTTEQALRHLQAALAIDPGYGPARHNLARVLAGMGRLREARAAYLKLTSSVPTSADAWAELGGVELALGERDAAGHSSRTALELAPQHPVALRVSADLLRDGGEPGKALTLYDQILATSPLLPEALLSRGVTLMVLGRAAEARRDLERAVGCAPRSAEARLALGAVLAELNLPERAATELGRAVELRSASRRPYPEAHYLRGGVLLRLGRRRDALGAFRQFLQETRGQTGFAPAIAEAKAQVSALAREDLE